MTAGAPDSPREVDRERLMADSHKDTERGEKRGLLGTDKVAEKDADAADDDAED